MVTGCVLPPAAVEPPPPRNPEPRYYVASVDTSSSTAVSADDGLKVLDQRAIEVLRPGIKVAFFPPDQCRNISAASTNATQEQVELANNCGVLISSLETSVADRYGVVSWQTLKGDDPFARAEARKVDVIFEVDSFGMNTLGQDAASAGSIDFYTQQTEHDRAPLVLGPDELNIVGQRCKATVDRIDLDRKDAGMVGSFTGAIKAVEVSSGQALLYYQRTLTDDPGETSSDGYDLYYESIGRIDYIPPDVPQPEHNALQKGGVALTITGATLFVLGSVLRASVFRATDEDGDGIKEFQQPGTGASAGMATAGFFMTGGGITMLVFGNRKAKRTPAPTVTQVVPPPSYAPPRNVLCAVPTTPPWLRMAPEVAPSPESQGGSSYSFSETKTAGRDVGRELENRLRKNVIDDFTTSLSELGSN